MNVISFFCQSIRNEKSGAKSYIGVFDNLVELPCAGIFPSLLCCSILEFDDNAEQKLKIEIRTFEDTDIFEYLRTPDENDSFRDIIVQRISPLFVKEEGTIEIFTYVENSGPIPSGSITFKFNPEKNIDDFIPVAELIDQLEAEKNKTVKTKRTGKKEK